MREKFTMQKKRKKMKGVEDPNGYLDEMLRTLMNKFRRGLIYVKELTYSSL